MKKILPALFLGGFVLAVTGCGSSGASTTAVAVAAVPTPGSATNGYPAAPPPGTTTTSGGTASAKFHISVPPSTSAATSASNSRHVAFVSSGTKSIQISLTSVNGSTPTTATTPLVANLTAGSSNCAATAGADSGVTCTVSFATLPVGLDGFTLTTYDGLLAAGDPLSTNKVVGSILVGQITTIPVTLAGIIKTLFVTLNQSAASPFTKWLTSGTGFTPTAIITTENDASGAQIIGSYPFQNAANVADSVTVTTNDVLSTIALASASLANPTSIDTFGYSGVGLANGAVSVTVTDALNSAIAASTPIHVISTPETLGTVGTPVDALLPTALTFPSGVTNGAYSANAGNDSSIVATLAQPGWGTAADPFILGTNTCVGETPVLSGVGGTTITWTGTSAQTAQAACTEQILGGGSQVITVTFALTGSANGGNFNIGRH